MTSINNQTQQFNTVLLAKRMLIGGGIALFVILYFVLNADNDHPDWGKYWMLRPLIITPLAGAAGGGLTYILNHFLGSGAGWKKALAIILSFFGYIIALWLGTVIGLAGTMWN